MVGIVIVSHSEKLAKGVVELAKQMTGGKDIPIKDAGGLEDGNIGTSFEKILKAINEAYTDDGVLILTDLGSAIMATQMCIESLPENMQSKIKLCNAPLVEGAVAAAAAAAQGLALEEVKRSAEGVSLIKINEKMSQELKPQEITEDKNTKSVEVQIINPTGLHARPAAAFVQLAAKFKSKIVVQNISAKKPPADAKSIMEMAINGTAEKGEWIRITAQGEDAEDAIKSLRELVESGFGELEEKSEEKPEEEKDINGKDGIYKGISIYPGYVVAPAFVYKHKVKTEKNVSSEKSSIEEEIKKLKDAIEIAINEIENLRNRISKEGDPKVASIFDFHIMVLRDKKLLDEAKSLIEEENLSAKESISKVLEEWTSKLEKQSTPLMKERAADLKDINNRILRILSGEETSELLEKSRKVILIAEDLLPSEIASLDRNFIAGIAIAKGGTTSHAAILARMWGIPSVFGLGLEIMKIPDSTLVALDGTNGKLILNPSTEIIEIFNQKQKEAEKTEKELIESAREIAITQDGHRIKILANVSNLETVSEVLKYGAEGIGLLRTEFLYVDRINMPSEEEQYIAYSQIAEIMDQKPVIIRTLDVGGDKPLPYIHMQKEDNPFLGVRAIRLQRLYPDLLKEQIKAILRAAVKGNLKFMVPMVATIEEVRWVKELVEESKKELEKMGLEFAHDIDIGIMIEIPSAAILSDILAKEVDFLSIGTNDLTQYTLACDRGNKNLSYLFDSLNPAILRLIKMTVDGAHANGKWVSVCGEMAGEREAIPILVGLGIDELSMNTRLIPIAKNLIRSLRYNDLKILAEEALKLKTAQEVRKFVLEQCGL